jgi:hypothetical protein
VAVKLQPVPAAATEEQVLTIDVSLGDEQGSARVTDEQVIETVRHCGGGDLGQGAKEVLTVGCRVLSRHSTDIDLHSIRWELASTVESAREGVKTEVEMALGENGIFATTQRRASDEFLEGMRREIVKQADPEVVGSLLAQFGAMKRQFDRSISDGRNDFLQDLARQNREMRERDDKMLEGIDKKLGTIAETFASDRAREAESERGHLKGLVYEDLVTAAIAEIAHLYGDNPQHTGGLPGFLPGSRGAAKRGDVTSTIEDKVKLVFEAMDRVAVTESAVKSEVAGAMKNRGAAVGVAVLASDHKPWMCSLPFKMLGTNMYVVILDKEIQDGAPLRLVYGLARKEALATVAPSTAIDVGRIRQQALDVQDQLKGIADVRTYLCSAADWTQKARSALDEHDQPMRRAIQRLITLTESEEPALEVCGGDSLEP